MFGRVTKCAEKKCPTSLIKSIMQYTSPNSAIPALKWGRENEDRARKEHNTQMKADHANFSVKSSVLCLNTEYLYLGATPDGFISCSCCGEGLLEIKCPYKYLT